MSAELIKTHWDDLVAGKNLDRVRLHSLELESGESQAGPQSELQAGEAEQQVAELSDKAAAASVRISEVGQTKGIARGVIVTPDGYVVTCGHHNRLPGHTVKVSLLDGRDASGMVLGTNPLADVGLIKITDEGKWAHAQLGHSANIQPGDRCIMIGYPNARPGRTPWMRETVIIQPTQTLPRRDEWYYQFWTAGYPDSLSGASGGGVFDMQGRVIGVLLGGAGDEMQHSRVEVFRKQWNNLAASHPVDVLDSEPLAEITAVFRHIAEELQPISVEVLVDGKQRALGTIVGSDGLVLTKSSVLEGSVSCRLVDGREMSASVQKRSREHDLAILKIDAAGLPAARWSEADGIVPGTLIAALVPGQQLRVGIVSIAARPIPPATGGLGVSVRNGDHGLEIHHVVAHEYEVPLCKGDIVVHVEGQPTPNLNAFHSLIDSGAAITHAGDPVRVGVRRGRETLEFHFPLPPSNFLIQHYGARSSLRWWGFPSVFGTDILLTPKQCGGPVIDKSGRSRHRHCVPERVRRHWTAPRDPR